MAHAFLSASGSPYWMICEAKPWREKDLPQYDSIYAIEGTTAHKMLEHFVTPGGALTPSEEESIVKSYPEMANEVQKTISLILKYDYTELYSEKKVDISYITGEQGAVGTVDVILVGKDHVTIIDLKYGKGVKVNAVDNSQLLIYGAAALNEYNRTGEINTLNMVIHQPRIKNHVSEWTLTRGEVKEKIIPIRETSKRILSAKGGDLSLRATPGRKQCQFCRAKSVCPEYVANKKPKAVDSDFEDLTKEE